MFTIDMIRPCEGPVTVCIRVFYYYNIVKNAKWPRWAYPKCLYSTNILRNYKSFGKPKRNYKVNINIMSSIVITLLAKFSKKSSRVENGASVGNYNYTALAKSMINFRRRRLKSWSQVLLDKCKLKIRFWVFVFLDPLGLNKLCSH